MQAPGLTFRQARTTDPATSREATKVNPGHDASVRERIVKIFTACNLLTDEELIRKYEMLYGATPHSTIRTRRKELERDGKVQVVDSHGTVVGTGRKCQVYKLVVS